MARIAGVDIPKNKRLEIGLTYIYGIGTTRAKWIVKEMGYDPSKRVNELTDDEVVKLRDKIEENYKIEGDLRQEVRMSIKRLMDLGCYRGIRHRKGLPVRGQSTRQNARTRKGPKKTVAGKKKV